MSYFEEYERSKGRRPSESFKKYPEIVEEDMVMRSGISN